MTLAKYLLKLPALLLTLLLTLLLLSCGGGGIDNSGVGIYNSGGGGIDNSDGKGGIDNSDGNENRDLRLSLTLSGEDSATERYADGREQTLQASLLPTGNTDAFSYEWQVMRGGEDASDQVLQNYLDKDPFATFKPPSGSASGPYQITAIAKNANSEIRSETLTITLVDGPLAQFTANHIQPSENGLYHRDKIILDAHDSRANINSEKGHALLFAWQLKSQPERSKTQLPAAADQPSADHINSVFTPDKPGEYTVELTITSTTDGSTHSHSKTLSVVNRKPSITIQDGPLALYPGHSRQLTAYASDPDKGDTLHYTWQATRNGETVSETLLVHQDRRQARFTMPINPTPGHHYQITATAHDNHGAQQAATLTLTATPPLQAIITSLDDRITKATTATWSAIESTGIGITYQWTMVDAPYKDALISNNNRSKNFRFTPNQDGKYQLRLTVTDSSNNSDSSDFFFIVGAATNRPPIHAGIITVDPSGLQQGRSQYLMVLGHDPDGDVLSTAWQTESPNCGIFEDHGRYHNSLFALLHVFDDATDCSIAVSLSNPYEGGTTTTRHSFAQPQPPLPQLSLFYRKNGTDSRRFSLPAKSASYTIPAHYYDRNNRQTAHQLQLPAGWLCQPSCANTLLFTTAEQHFSITNKDMRITLTLLANNNPARAVINRADLEQLHNNRAAQYYQLATIDLGGSLHRPDHNNNPWTAIGTYAPAYHNNKPFNGLYDGQQLPIRNLLIAQPQQSYLGLFGHSNESTLQNISLQGVDIRGSNHVGALLGFSSSGTIRNSYAIGFVAGNDYVGGLSGRYGRSHSLHNSYARGVVSGNDYVGGLLGQNESQLHNNFANTFVTGNSKLGGLLGSNDGSLENSYANAFVTGHDHIGGLSGTNLGSIEKSYASGSVSGNGNNVGGLLGYNGGGTISASYWDTTIEDSPSEHGEGKTTTDMRQQTSYDSWDFATIWGIDDNSDTDPKKRINSGYPYLLCINGQEGYQAQAENCAPSNLSFHIVAENNHPYKLYPGDSRTLTTKQDNSNAHGLNYRWKVLHNGRDVTAALLTIYSDGRARFTAPADAKNGSTYQISVTINNPYGNSISTTQTLTVFEALKAVITMSDGSLEQGQPGQWSAAASSGRDLSYKWTVESLPIDGFPIWKSTGPLKSGDTLDYTPEEAGKYRIALTVTDILGNSDSDYYLFFIGPRPAPLQSSIIVVDPDGLRQGGAQYLMLQARDFDGDKSVTEWSIDPPSCGDFSDNGKYQKGPFALLYVASDALVECIVSVAVYDAYNNNAPISISQRFAVLEAPLQTLPFTYIGNAETAASRRFTLPAKSAYYTIPAHYYSDNGDSIQAAASLQLPNEWRCNPLCDQQRVSFANRKQSLTITQDDITITLSLLARDNPARAVINKKDLDQVRHNLAEHYYQLAAINLGGLLYRPSIRVEYWPPIMNFEGLYDGQLLPLRNLLIQQPEENDIGLFGSSKKATIRGIGLQGVYIAGQNNVGALVGNSSNSSISYNYVIGSVSGSNSVGGLLGSSSSSSIRHSYVIGKIDGTNNIGGLIGSSNNSSISNNHTNGHSSGQEHIGGLIGNSHNSNIRHSYARGKIVGNTRVGGLVGTNNRDISGSYASGHVVGSSKTGGLVGYNHSNIRIGSSYWDKIASQQEISAASINDTGKTTTEMKRLSTYSNWINFGDNWGISPTRNNGYPHLLCVGGQDNYSPRSSSCAPKPFSFSTEDKPNIFYPGEKRTFTVQQTNEAPKAFDYRWQVMLNGQDVTDQLLDIGEYSVTFTAPADAVSGSEYLITSIIDNPYGSSSSESDTITVTAKPKAVITVPPDPNADENSIPTQWLATESIGEGLNYQWTLDLSPENASKEFSGANSDTLRYGPDKAGKYRIKLTVTDILKNISIAYYSFSIGNMMNRVPLASAIISIDPSGLKQGHTQYLMVLASDPDGDALSTQWTVAPTSCGTFVADGQYHDTLFAQLAVPTDAADDCTVSVSVSNPYANGTTTITQHFAAPQPAIITQQFSYIGGAVEATARNFTLPVQSAAYIVPSHYYDNNGIVVSAKSLQIPDNGHCESTCDQQQIAFTDTQQTITVTEGDIHITLTLLEKHDTARAILNRSDLERISDSNGEQASPYYQLAAIDLGGILHQADNDSNHWTAIGTPRQPFTGFYNGQRLPIRHLRIQRPQQDFTGLFGYTASGSKIQNIALQGLDVHGKDHVGGLIGHSNGTVEHSYVRGAVAGNSKIGGLLGYSGHSNIRYSHATAAVVGKIALGGLLGYNEQGTIAHSYARSMVAGNSKIGGLLGENMGQENANSGIDNSYANSSVSGNHRIGGLVGFNHSGHINNSYANGPITDAEFVGGLVGYQDGSSTIHASYWDSGRSGQKHSSGSLDSDGKNSADMQTRASYNNWAFGSIWAIDEASNNDARQRINGGYPYLLCLAGQQGYRLASNNCTLSKPTLTIADDLPHDLYAGNSRILKVDNESYQGRQGLHYHWQAIRDGQDVSDAVLSDDDDDPSTITFNVPADTTIGSYQVIVTISSPYDSSSTTTTLSVVELKAVINPPDNTLINSAAQWSATESTGVGLSYLWTMVGYPQRHVLYLHTEVDSVLESTLLYAPDQNGKYQLRLTVMDIYGKHVSDRNFFIVGKISNPIADDILSVDPSGLKQGRAQYLMVQARDLNLYDGSKLDTAWSSDESCGTFADNGMYKSSLFALLHVAADATEPCTISVAISNYYGGTTRVEKRLAAPQPTAAELEFSYITDGLPEHHFTLSSQDVTAYTIPSRYHSNDGNLRQADQLRIQLPDAWHCDGCGSDSLIAFDRKKTFVVTKNDNSISITLLADSDSAQAILRRADLEGINHSNHLAKDYYQLAAIDLGGQLHHHPDSDDIHYWTAIGTPNEQAFTGSYDGQQLPLRNLRISRPTELYIGLFGYIAKSGSIKNIALQGSNTYGATFVGGLVGANDGKITNSYAIGTVSGSQERFSGGLLGGIGGLVGGQIFSGRIDSSYAHGSVSGNINVGGLVGINQASRISNSYATGIIRGGGNRETLPLGGLVGWNENGHIDSSYASGNVSGGAEIGGLVGYNNGGGDTNSGISNSYATGNVSGHFQSPNGAGGLVGYNDDKISNSYATGNVALKTNSRIKSWLVGYNDDTIISSYWDSANSGLGLSPSDYMRNQEAYSGWDFDTIWAIDSSDSDFYQRINRGYPYLLCVTGQDGHQPPDRCNSQKP